ncbi:MAG: hypothetical protein FWD17_18950, partial [Polyangiaceae bacterium]|nr:hypothetical protein [Polyangiaceae bacterium]
MNGPSQPRVMRRALWDLAEIAIEAPSFDVFARLSLEGIAKSLSMDAGAINRATLGARLSAITLGLPPEPMNLHLHEYLDEMTQEELRRALSGRPVVDRQAFAPA